MSKKIVKLLSTLLLVALFASLVPSAFAAAFRKLIHRVRTM